MVYCFYKTVGKALWYITHHGLINNNNWSKVFFWQGMQFMSLTVGCHTVKQWSIHIKLSILYILLSQTIDLFLSALSGERVSEHSVWNSSACSQIGNKLSDPSHNCCKRANDHNSTSCWRIQYVCWTYGAPFSVYERPNMSYMYK